MKGMRYPDLLSTELPPVAKEYEACWLAAWAVLRNAHDAADARLLLDALGLTPAEAACGQRLAARR